MGRGASAIRVLEVYGYGAFSCPPCSGLMTWRNPHSAPQNTSFALRTALALPQDRPLTVSSNVGFNFFQSFLLRGLLVTGGLHETNKIFKL